MVFPAEMPVISPEIKPTVAIAVLALVHDPLPPSDKVEVVPIHATGVVMDSH